MAGLSAGSIIARKEESGGYGSAQHVWSQRHQLQQPGRHSYVGVCSSPEAGDGHHQ